MSTSLERILYVDLTERRTHTVSRPELFVKYLGGTGVASKLLVEECPQKVDPFSPQAPIIIATGPMVGLFPCMAKAVAMFKSPLTGNLGESHAGGRFSSALRFANYGAIVIKGASNRPVYVAIGKENSIVEDASSLWGLSPLQVEKAMNPPNSKGVVTVMSIGIAGENLVYYSGAMADRYHHFGRLGLGAVMGSKKLKAIHIRGTEGILLSGSAEFRGLSEEICRRVVEADSMKKYHELGTAANVLELNALGALPSKNFRETIYEKANNVSGERYAEEFCVQKISCPSCPITCIHVADLRTSFAHQRGREKGEICEESELVPYHYEPIFALGINLDVSDPKGVLRLISRCEHLGLDAMMTGAVLAWATEAYEKSLITITETMGLQPMWGDTETYVEMIENISKPQTPFYAALARGVSAAAEKYGGEAFAVSLGKNSPAGYFTGYGFVVGTLVGARHSHLNNAGYSIDQTAMATNVSPQGIVEFLVEEEDRGNVLNSLVACYFARKVYGNDLLLRALAAIGIEQTEEGLKRLGKEISHNLYTFKVREGFDLTKEKVPKRLLEAKSPRGFLDPKVIQEMILHYITVRESEGLRLNPNETGLVDLFDRE